MKITNDIVRNSSQCSFKVKHLWNNEIPKEGLEIRFEYLNRELRKKYLIENCIKSNKLLLSDDLLDVTPKLHGFYEVRYFDADFDLYFPLIEFSNQTNGIQRVIVYFFFAKNEITKEDLLYCRDLSGFLSSKNLTVNQIKCILSVDNLIRVKKYRIDDNKRQISLKDKIKKITEDEKSCPTRLSYCSVCQLNNYCSQILIGKEDLKLLGRISDKEVSRIKSKGIFTISQLSFTFKPRKRKLNSNGRYLYELKALSLRDGKTHVLNKKVLPKSENDIYVDFEGDLKFSVYLIGVVLVKNGIKIKYSFWADRAGDEKIFEDFFEFLLELDGGFCLCHYGSYEKRALQKMGQKYPKIKDYYDSLHIEERVVNLLDYFYSDVFPPTYSNSLKEIANYLGFKWSKQSTNGFMVSHWRNEWLEYRKTKIKRRIITYNIEDCLALIVIRIWLRGIFEGKPDLKTIVPDTRKYLRSMDSYKYGRNKFLIEEYQEANRLAYFSYQREKVVIRDKEFRKGYTSRNFAPKVRNRINTHEYPSIPAHCERCGSLKLNTHQNLPRKIIDLKISTAGIQKNCILFHGKRFRCEECRFTFTPSSYVRQPRYGYNLKVWIINQIITYRTSYGDIRNSLSDYFQISLSITYITRIRSEFADRYQVLFNELKKALIQGNLIQCDETKINLRKESGYVWVLTSLNTVIYLYRPSREGKFLHGLLEKFTGIMVSDFYAAYDSLDCSQQKCLIHLIRDLNDDLFRNQLNIEIKEIAQEFGILLKEITRTVDKHGLKKRNLKKHIKDVDRFFNKLEKRTFVTEIGKAWVKRFTRNEEKLFTFLRFDGVPWNNNNAEHAIKSLAYHRREINGFYERSGIEEFLILLSIEQTCKFRGISFWEFLKSKEVNFEKSK